MNPLKDFVQADKDKKLADKVHRLYRSAVSYKTSAGLYEKWDESERFWLGEQWPEVSPTTKNLPRPMTNHYASIIEQKVAGLTYDLPEMFFEPVEDIRQMEIEMQQGGQNEIRDIDAADILSHITRWQGEKVGLQSILDEVARMAAKMGTGILFSPWDNSIIGGGPNARYIGDIRCSCIDNGDFYTGDPTNPKLQEQPWVMLAERRPKKEIVEYYAEWAPEIVQIIETDDLEFKPVFDHKTEQDDADYVDILHYFWKVPLNKDKRKAVDEVEKKEEGETTRKGGKPAGGDNPKEAKPSQDMPQEQMQQGMMPGQEMMPGMLEQKPGAMMPPEQGMMPPQQEPEEIRTHKLNYAVVCQGYVLRKEVDLYRHGLYPFVSFNWYPRRKSFWGKGEAEDLIPNQKEENRLAGIALMSAHQTGLPNIRYRPDFVRRSDIPTGPGGGIIPDRSPGNWSIDYLHPPTPASHIPQLRESLSAGMKEVSGVHEAWTGKAPSADLNASAIMALQEAAGVRIRGIQRRLMDMVEDLGRLWLAHWKEFWEEERMVRVAGESKSAGFFWFTMTAFRDMEFDIRCQAGANNPFSKTLQSTALDGMFDRGLITPEEYFEMLPLDVFPKADILLERRMQRMEQQKMEELEARLAIINQAVSEIVAQSQAAGVPVDAQAVSGLMEILQQTEQEIAQMQQQQGGMM